jgi:hypothetical protein
MYSVTAGAATTGAAETYVGAAAGAAETYVGAAAVSPIAGGAAINSTGAPNDAPPYGIPVIVPIAGIVVIVGKAVLTAGNVETVPKEVVPIGNVVPTVGTAVAVPMVVGAPMVL